jgi:hypothetical protein
MPLQGSCHCGRIAYSIDAEPKQVLDCNCSHCRRKGYLLWFQPREKLTLATPESAMQTYTFNKHVIKHQFCPHCGCAPFGFGKDKEGNEVVAINVRCLPDVDLSKLKITPVDGRRF